jgi:hypothetical protein
LHIGFLLRILFGPFTHAGVVAFHYVTRADTVSLLHMLTFQTGLKTLFILDFNRMAAVSEKKVMIWMCVSTSTITLLHLALEVVTRNIRGLDHYARMCINTYLGKVVM